LDGKVQHRITQFVAHYSSTDYEKSYYIYDSQGNVMAIYSENKVSSVTTTRQDEVPIYGSDRLGLVRRNLELDEEQARTTQLAKECPYCPVPQTIAPGMLRIVEVLYDSPLSNPTEDHTGEFVVLRNATGLTLPLASISITYPGGVFTFGASDVLAPYEFAIVAHWSGSPGSFAAQFGLSGYNTFPEVNWFWDTAMTLPDPASRGRSAGGTVGLLDFTDGVPTLLDAVNFDFQRRGPSASLRMASDAYCATACSTAQTVQLDHFLTSPSGAFDAGEWAAATITGMGTIGIGSFVLDHSYARGLGMREYELKDHLGNVRAVVSDKKMSTIVSGLPEDFRAEVLTMRDHYAFGMDLPGAVFTGSSGYRYGFNGMERDDEVKGAGMSYDFGARVYDPRVGRWWSGDPLEGKYPWMAPFVAMNNNPILQIDRDGRDSWIYLENGDFYGHHKDNFPDAIIIVANHNKILLERGTCQEVRQYWNMVYEIEPLIQFRDEAYTHREPYVKKGEMGVVRMQIPGERPDPKGHMVEQGGQYFYDFAKMASWIVEKNWGSPTTSIAGGTSKTLTQGSSGIHSHPPDKTQYSTRNLWLVNVPTTVGPRGPSLQDLLADSNKYPGVFQIIVDEKAIWLHGRTDNENSSSNSVEIEFNIEEYRSQKSGKSEYGDPRDKK
jgi:RHS repeat-associated protein